LQELSSHRQQAGVCWGSHPAAPQVPTRWRHSGFKRISEFCFLEIGTIWSLFSELWRH